MSEYRKNKLPQWGNFHPAIWKLADEMQAKIDRDFEKGDWREVSVNPLSWQLDEEIVELTHATMTGGPKEIWAEAADVANFAMFIADKMESER